MEYKNLSKDKIDEAVSIIANGKEVCFSETDLKWAIDVLRCALVNGYGVVKVS